MEIIREINSIIVDMLFMAVLMSILYVLVVKLIKERKGDLTKEMQSLPECKYPPPQKSKVCVYKNKYEEAIRREKIAYIVIEELRERKSNKKIT